MILALIVLVPILLISLWAFIRFSPKGGSRQQILLFNLGVLAVALVLCALLTLKIYSHMAAGPDRAWWTILSVLGTLAVFSIVLVVGGLVRNLLVFRPPNIQG
jgi:hypothetical protein